jgi:hypothetical protein
MRVPGAPALRTPARLYEAKRAACEIVSVAGILRGLGWGLVIEGAGALLLYGIWHFALTVR